VSSRRGATAGRRASSQSSRGVAQHDRYAERLRAPHSVPRRWRYCTCRAASDFSPPTPSRQTSRAQSTLVAQNG